MDLFSTLSQFVINGNAEQAREVTEKGLEQGISPEAILRQGLMAGMGIVGERFGKGEIWLPEVLLSARAMKGAVAILEPMLAHAGVSPVGRAILGTVQGDIHDIGKNLVGMMMKGAGFEVIDLGIKVPPEKFVDAVKQTGVELVGMSAVISTTRPFLKTTIEAFTAAGLRDKVKIMVGGAIVTPAYAQSIGADGYAPDAASAVTKAKELLGIK